MTTRILCLSAIVTAAGCAPDPEPHWKITEDRSPPAWLSVEREGDRVAKVVINVDAVAQMQCKTDCASVVATVTNESGVVVVEFVNRPE